MLATFIMITGLGIVLFLCTLIGFIQGVRLGMNAVKGIPPKTITQSLKQVKETINPKPDLIAEGFANLMNYTGEVKMDGEHKDLG